MEDTDGGSDERARTSAHDLVADHELGHALDHVEGIDVIRMAVGFHTFEVRPESQVDHFELWKFRQDAVIARAARDSLAVARVNDDSSAHSVASRPLLLAAGMAGAYPPQLAAPEAPMFEIKPETALFIDDSPANVDAASALGFRVIRFTDATALRLELVDIGLLPDGCAAQSPG